MESWESTGRTVHYFLLQSPVWQRPLSGSGWWGPSCWVVVVIPVLSRRRNSPQCSVQGATHCRRCWGRPPTGRLPLAPRKGSACVFTHLTFQIWGGYRPLLSNHKPDKRLGLFSLEAVTWADSGIWGFSHWHRSHNTAELFIHCSWLSSPQHCLPLSWELFQSSSMLPNSSLPFQICYHQPLPTLVCPSFLRDITYAFISIMLLCPSFNRVHTSLSTWKYSVS